MREVTTDITRLCESWWEKISDSTKTEHHRYAQELLHLLDWREPLPFSPPPEAEALSAVPYLLRAGGQTTVIAFFVMPGTLEPPTAVLERGLDYCEATCSLVRAARRLNVHYVLATDLYRSYLYDAHTEELLLSADTPRAFDAEMAAVLNKAHMERGSLDGLRRQPRSVVARRLREWRARCAETVSQRGHVSEHLAALFLDRLTVLNYLFQHDIVRRTKRHLQARFAEVCTQAAGPAPEGCGTALVKLFHDMWLDWRLDLFEASPELDRVLEEDGVVVPVLREFALLSRSKFHIATLLESFNHGDPTEKMRVRMVPDQNEERDLYLAKQTLDSIDEARIEIDLMEEGYRALSHWFDKVVALYERLEDEFDTRAQQNAADTAEMDLFAWSEMDAARPEACADRFAHACERGFGAYYNSLRQYRIARLLLTLHLVSRYAEARAAVNRFPSFANVLMKRPKILPAERIMKPTMPAEWDASDEIWQAEIRR